MEKINGYAVNYFDDYETMIDYLKVVRTSDGKLITSFAQYGEVFKAGNRYYVYSDKGLQIIKTEGELAEESMRKELMSLLSYQVDKNYKTYERMGEEDKEKYGNYADDIIKLIKRYVKKIEF